MLIRFTIENFLSFNERQVFSMLPGKGTLKSEHRTPVIKGVSILKTTALFGANASGKSNLVKAIDFGKNLVLNGVRPDNPIDYQKFKLDEKSRAKDSMMEYEIQYKGKNYAYGFVFNTEMIKKEWLYEIGSTKRIKIFERDSQKTAVFDLKYLLRKLKKEEEKQFLRFTAKGTPDNQLFLTEIRTRRIKENVSRIDSLLHVNDWFQNSLKIVCPDDKYNKGLSFELSNNEEFVKSFEDLLRSFDTGIDGVCLEKIDTESVDLPKLTLDKIREDLLSRNEEERTVILSSETTTYLLSAKENEIIFEKLMTKHKVENSDRFEKFDTGDESAGTNRTIDYILVLLDLFKDNRVFIIDEIERSLHPNLLYSLLDLFLSNVKNLNSQLIMATHESSLLTQKLLRKDEIWFVAKDDKGASKLYSLGDYSVRFDKEIRKDYLLGKFGAIPHINKKNHTKIRGKF